MYTAYDFINTNVSGRHMRFGWIIEILHSEFNSRIVLRYTMINFKWDSFNMLGDEAWDMFLSSKSYKTMKLIKDKADSKFKRTYFEAFSIEVLKRDVEKYGLKIDIDKLISKTISKKSKKIKEKHGIITTELNN